MQNPFPKCSTHFQRISISKCSTHFHRNAARISKMQHAFPFAARISKMQHAFPKAAHISIQKRFPFKISKNQHALMLFNGNRFPLNNINACWFLLLVQCAQTVLKFSLKIFIYSHFNNGRWSRFDSFSRTTCHLNPKEQVVLTSFRFRITSLLHAESVKPLPFWVSVHLSQTSLPKCTGHTLTVFIPPHHNPTPSESILILNWNR